VKYIALLRGINVGGRNIKMTALRDCFVGMGYGQVKTILASGNVMFETDIQDVAALRAKIEARVGKQFGYRAIIFVYSEDVIKKILLADPFAPVDSNFHDYVAFFDGGFEKRLGDFHSPDADVERTQVGDGVLYWVVQKGMTLTSRLAKEMNQSIYREHCTVRNTNTLRKLIT